MSYSQAHHKSTKPAVGVPHQQQYQQAPRHSAAQRHQSPFRTQVPPARDARQYSKIAQPTRHPSPIPIQPQGPRLTGSPSPSASSGAVPQQQPTALGTSGPHDMNKQGAPNRPALTPSPVQQGTILPGQPMLINHQQIMYAQQPNLPRAQTVTYVPVQTNQRTNTRSGIPMSNITPTQQGGQPQTTYQPNPQLTMAAPPFIPNANQHLSQQPPPPQPTAQYMIPQQMMMPQPNMFPGRFQYHHQPATVYQQPSTPPYYQTAPPVSATTGAFYQQNQQMVATQAPQLRAQGQALVQQPQPRLVPKKRNIIRIVDPSSNTDITEAILREGTSSTGTTPTHSGRSSASSTPPASGPPPPTQQSQLNDKDRAIQASFAAQVALAAAADTKPPLPLANNSKQGMLPPQVPPPHMVPPPQMNVHMPLPPPSQGPVLGQAPPKVPPPQTVVPAKTVIADKAAAPVIVNTQIQKPVSVPMRPVDAVPAPTTVVMAQTTPISAPVPAPAVPTHAVPKQVQEQVTEKVEPVAESDPTPNASAKSEEQVVAAHEPVAEQEAAPVSSDKVINNATVKVAEKPEPDSASKLPPMEVEAPKEDPIVKEVSSDKAVVVAETPLPVTQLPVDDKPIETAKQEPASSKSVPQEETVEKTVEKIPIKESKEIKQTKETIPQKKETAAEAKQAPPAKENNRKKNQKKRLQELDKKSGKDDDMFDAYKDKDESTESTPAAPVVEEIKEEVKEEITTTPAIEKPPQQAVPVKNIKEAQPKTELPQPEKKPEVKPHVESEKLLTEKEIPKVEVSVVDSDDKKERDKVEAENAKNKESIDIEVDNNKPAPKDDKIQLKYTYREDQWSPVNPEGKKQYGRDFLLQFQPECKDKPDGLPHIPDIVLDKADIRPISGVPEVRLQSTRGGGGGGGGRGGGIDPFVPDYIRIQRGNQIPQQFPQSGGRRSSRDPPKKVIARASQGPEVNLKKAENAWKPGGNKNAEEKTEEEMKTMELIKNFKGILNKLTPQNFQTLMAKTLQLPIDNEERLTSIIDLVFEKAISESAFSKAYANMCRVLSQIKVPAANDATGLVQFRTVLINRCQRAFEAEKKEEATWEEMKKVIEALKEGSSARQVKEEELFGLQIKAKGKVLGNMRFIGELFKLKMLTEPIMHDCLFKLLRAKDEESLECMSQLMTTVGKDLDHERAKNRIDQYFTQIAKIIANKKISARIRFMLQDVEDLRKCKWIPRRDDNNPKTIAQIHQEAKKEEQQKKIEAQMSFHVSKSREGSHGGKGSRGSRPGPSQQDGSDWQTVAASNKGRPQIDPSKLINLGRNRHDNDNVQLGPGGRPGSFGSWGRGSSGGGAKMQSASGSGSGSGSSDSVDLRPTGNNRFAMLSDQGRGSRPGMAPPTRDSKGRPTTSLPARRSRERDDSGSARGSGERKQLLDEVSRMSTGSGPRSSSIEKDRKSSRDRLDRGSRDRGSRDKGSSNRGSSDSREKGSRERGNRDSGSREKVSSRERATPSPKPSKLAVQLSDEEFEKKGKATLDEYINIKDLKEACTCLSELDSPDRMHIFVRLSVEHVLEMDTKSRLATGDLFFRLIKERILSVQQYLQGLNEVLEYAEDMAIDIPLIWQYLGDIMGSVIQDKSLPIDYLSRAVEPVKRANKAGVLLAEIFRMAENNIGAADLNDLWQSAGFTWEQFLPADENASEFVHNKKLEYTLQTSKGKKSDSGDSLAKMETELGFMLARDKCDNNEIFDWIEKNVQCEQRKQKDFIRALVTLVCQSITKGDDSIRGDPDILKVRAKCLLRYIDGDVNKELQALYAVQALNFKLVNPPGLLRLIFDVLYDEDVISEETFYAWQNSTDPAEKAGKGVALKSVTSFFIWLGEAEEDVGS